MSKYNPFLCDLITYDSHVDIVLKLFCFDQNIMKDRWINMGYEDRELKPYKEPSKDVLDTQRIGKQALIHTCSVYWLKLQYSVVFLC